MVWNNNKVTIHWHNNGLFYWRPHIYPKRIMLKGDVATLLVVIILPFDELDSLLEADMVFISLAECVNPANLGKCKPVFIIDNLTLNRQWLLTNLSGGFGGDVINYHIEFTGHVAYKNIGE